MHANESPVFDDQQVADYLLRHPTFFEHHAELLTRVQLRSAHGPQAVVCQERQAELLREKIRNLEGRVAEWCAAAAKTPASPTKSTAGAAPWPGARCPLLAPCDQRRLAKRV